MKPRRALSSWLRNMNVLVKRWCYAAKLLERYTPTTWQLSISQGILMKASNRLSTSLCPTYVAVFRHCCRSLPYCCRPRPCFRCLRYCSRRHRYCCWLLVLAFDFVPRWYFYHVRSLPPCIFSLQLFSFIILSSIFTEREFVLDTSLLSSSCTTSFLSILTSSNSSSMQASSSISISLFPFPVCYLYQPHIALATRFVFGQRFLTSSPIFYSYYYHLSFISYFVKLSFNLITLISYVSIFLNFTRLLFIHFATKPAFFKWDERGQSHINIANRKYKRKKRRRHWGVIYIVCKTRHGASRGNARLCRKLYTKEMMRLAWQRSFVSIETASATLASALLQGLSQMEVGRSFLTM